jgi:hypothetical protein
MSKLEKTCVVDVFHCYSNSNGRAHGWNKCVVCNGIFARITMTNFDPMQPAVNTEIYST